MGLCSVSRRLPRVLLFARSTVWEEGRDGRTQGSEGKPSKLQGVVKCREAAAAVVAEPFGWRQRRRGEYAEVAGGSDWRYADGPTAG